MTILGQCKLCLKQTPLMDSHFIPRSMYSPCRDPSTGQNPVAVAEGVAQHSTDQIRDYVFCSDCEMQLNRNGEAWFHKNMARPEGFLIWEALQRVQPEFTKGGSACYTGRKVPGIDMGQLSYFGLSIFWKAAVHRWPRLNKDGSRMERLNLDKYEDPIHLFLLNAAPVPNDISLLISVQPDKDPGAGFNTPVGGSQGDYHSYSFYCHGVAFTLCVGRRIPSTLRKMSAFSVSDGYIFASTEAGAQITESFAKAIRKALRVGKLKQEFPEKN